MPIRFEVDDSGTFFIANWEGHVTDREIIPAYVSFFEGNKWQPGMHELTVVSEANMSQVSETGLHNLARFQDLFYREHKLNNVRTAIYVRPDKWATLAILYQVWSINSPEWVKLFRNKEKAAQWLMS